MEGWTDGWTDGQMPLSALRWISFSFPVADVTEKQNGSTFSLRLSFSPPRLQSITPTVSCQYVKSPTFYFTLDQRGDRRAFFHPGRFIYFLHPVCVGGRREKILHKAPNVCRCFVPQRDEPENLHDPLALAR